MLEDRLRGLRLEEPRLVLDLDALVARAGATDRQRRSVLATILAVLLTAALTMVAGALRDVHGPAAGSSAPASASDTTDTTDTTPPTTWRAGSEVVSVPPPEACPAPAAAVWPKVLARHLPGTRLEPLRGSACPVYRLPGGGHLVLAVLSAGLPAEGTLVSDVHGPGGGRVQVYRVGRGRLVRWVDGRVTVQVATTGAVQPKVLIAIATDPVLRSEGAGPG